MSYKLIISPSDTSQLVRYAAQHATEEIELEQSENFDQNANVPDALTEADSLLWDWALCDALGERVSSGTASTYDLLLHTLAQNNINEFEVVNLVPSTLVFYSHISIPSKQQRVIQQALPFAVEELVAQDVQTLHIAMGDRVKNDIPVTVLDKSIFNTLFSHWQNEATRLLGIHVDSQLIPLGDNNIVVLICGEDCWVSGEKTAIKLNAAVMPFYIEKAIEEHYADTKEVAVKLYICREDTPDIDLVLANLQQIGNISLQTEDLSIKPIEFFADSYFHGPAAVNLCQGEYAVVKKSNANWKKWSSVAAVLLLWFIAEVGFNIGKGYYFQTKADNTLDQAIAEYKKVFPSDRRVSKTNITRFMKSKLQAAGQQNQSLSFLSILGETGSHFYQISDNKSMKMNSINFNAQRGEITIELQAKTLDQLDQLKNGIAKSGQFDAKISSAVKEKDYIRGRLNIKGGS